MKQCDGSQASLWRAASFWGTVATLSALVTWQSHCLAQDGAAPAGQVDSTTLERVTVTANRREQLEQDVPASLTVLTTQGIRDGQVYRLDDLSGRVPNLNIFQTRSSTNISARFIRGIGQEDTVFTVESGVGLYVDEVFMPRAQGALLDVYDIERIEVLRGPQGTLYGRNTPAGAISFYSKRPDSELGGDGEFVLGNYGRRNFRGSVNLPSADGKLLTRFTVSTINSDGFERDELTGRRTRDDESVAMRLNSIFQAAPALTVSFNADYVKQTPGISVGARVRPQTTAMNFAEFAAGTTTVIPKSEDPFVVRSNIQNVNDLDHWGISAKIDWQFSQQLKLRSITAFRRMEVDTRIDFDGTEASAADVYNMQRHRQFSQEFQGIFESRGYRGVAGLYFFRESDDQNDGTDASAKGFSIDSWYAQTTNSYAAYGQFDVDLTERTYMTLGVRYTEDKKDFSRLSERHSGNTAAGDPNLYGGFDTGPNGSPPDPLFPGNGLRLTDISHAKGSWGATTPRLGLTHMTSSGDMFFASVARGFKSGGFNGRASTLNNPFQGLPYNPEYVNTYEIGTKLQFLEGRTRMNATVFYNDYRDLQLASFVQSGNSFLSLFTNAAKAVTKGAEIEARSLVGRGGEVFTAIGYTDAAFSEYVERGVDVSSRHLSNAPRLTALVGANQIFPVRESGWRAKVGGDITYQSGRYLTVSNLADLYQSGYALVNVFFSFLNPYGNMSLTVGAKNLLDRRYKVAGVDASTPPFGIVNAFYGDPRTFTVTLRGSL